MLGQVHLHHFLFEAGLRKSWLDRANGWAGQGHGELEPCPAAALLGQGPTASGLMCGPEPGKGWRIWGKGRGKVRPAVLTKSKQYLPLQFRQLCIKCYSLHRPFWFIFLCFSLQFKKKKKKGITLYSNFNMEDIEGSAFFNLNMVPFVKSGHFRSLGETSDVDIGSSQLPCTTLEGSPSASTLQGASETWSQWDEPTFIVELFWTWEGHNAEHLSTEKKKMKKKQQQKT